MAKTDVLKAAHIGTWAPSYKGGHWRKIANGWQWVGPDGVIGGIAKRPGDDWTGKLLEPEFEPE